MKLPVDAGALLVDLRPRMGTRQRLLVVAVMVGAGLLPAGDPKLWPIAAFFGVIAVVSTVLIAVVRLASRRALAICEQGLVVRHGLATMLVPWTSVRRMHSRWRALRGSRVQEIIVDTDGVPVRFGFVPGQPSSAAYDDLTARAIAEIQDRAKVKLERK